MNDARVARLSSLYTGSKVYDEKLKGIRELIYCLPEVNRDTLYAILALLHIIQMNRTINMMTSENLARYVIFIRSSAMRLNISFRMQSRWP